MGCELWDSGLIYFLYERSNRSACFLGSTRSLRQRMGGTYSNNRILRHNSFYKKYRIILLIDYVFKGTLQKTQPT